MKIRRRKNPGGSVRWQLDLGVINGKRKVPGFATREEAEVEMFRLKQALKRSGYEGMSLSEGERVRYFDALKRLEAVGATLEEAVEFFCSHAKPLNPGVRWLDFIELALEGKAEEGQTAKYVKNLRSSAVAFARAGYAMTAVEDIQADDITKWLRSNEWEWKTWNNYRGQLQTLFEWGIEHKYLTLNPCAGVPIRKPTEGEDHEVEFLRLEQVTRLLDRAAAWRPGWAVTRNVKGTWVKPEAQDESLLDCLAAVVIGVFCGLRPEKELGKMDWSHVREDVVVVSSGRAKSRQRRVVDLQANAREWLKLCPVKEGKILPKNWKRKWQRLREQVGLYKGWPHDGLRHTFATMHLAHFKDEKALQLLMGHESAELIYAHYRGQETPANAALFWGLRPRLWGLALLLRDEG